MLSFRVRKAVPASPVDQLSRAFGNLSVNPRHSSPLEIKSPTSGYFVRYKSSRAKRHHPDLDLNGRILKRIIDERIAFLERQGLLKDPIVFNSRVVYANLHLFDFSNKTMMGQKNLFSLSIKERPVALKYQPVVIHHIDQCDSGDWAVITEQFHQENDSTLHSHVATSDPINRSRFSRETSAFWIHLSKILEEAHRLNSDRSRIFRA